MKEFNKIWAVAKQNLKYGTRKVYVISFLLFALVLIYNICNWPNSFNKNITSAACFLFVVPLLAPIVIASTNYTSIMNMGVSKKLYAKACLLDYLLLAALVSLANTLFYFILDKPNDKVLTHIYNFIFIYGWDNVFIAFICQLLLIFAIEIVVHTITAMQRKWYGILVDIGIVALCLFGYKKPMYFESIMISIFKVNKDLLQFLLLGLFVASLVYWGVYVYIKRRQK